MSKCLVVLHFENRYLYFGTDIVYHHDTFMGQPRAHFVTSETPSVNGTHRSMYCNIPGWSFHTPTLTVTLSHMKPCTVTSWGNSVTPLPSLLHYPWLILSHPYTHCYTHETMYCNILWWSYHTPTLTVTLSRADPITPLHSLLHYPTWNHVL